MVEWREGEREGGGLYTPQGTPRGIRRHVRSVPASMPAITLRLRNGNVHLIGTANNLRRTLTPSHFAPDPGNKRLAAFGRREFMVIDRSLRIARPISASSLQVVCHPLHDRSSPLARTAMVSLSARVRNIEDLPIVMKARGESVSWLVSNSKRLGGVNGRTSHVSGRPQ